MNRKSFIQRALNAWAVIVSLPVIYGLVRYAGPQRSVAATPVQVSAGKRSEFTPGTVKLIREGKTPFFVRDSGSGRFEAFSAKCSHLGCIVQFQGDQKNYRCNCHGSLFDENGGNITGPATKPLHPYSVEIRGDEVIVTVI